MRGGGISAFAHEGAVIGESTPMKPFNSPLKARERIAITEVGEEVLTARDPRHRRNLAHNNLGDIRSWVSKLPRYHEGGVVGGGRLSNSGGSGSLRVELINEGQPKYVADASMRLDLDSQVLAVLVKDGRKSGPITKMFKQIARG